MSESLYPPFLKWGDYTSKDEKHPDILNIEVLETETFETEFSINVRAKVDGIEKIIPLHSFQSKNKQLLQLWTDAVKNRKVKVGKKFKIKTWLGTSKNNNPIRRFELVF
ncbi:MAG: hypothetical protein FJ356_05140 [Thaumarchaeota archaeon]|nr:hypothetical protein [Nitrososphaerota archaeon]